MSPHRTPPLTGGPARSAGTAAARRTRRGGTTDITSLLTNSQTKPAYSGLDLRAFYELAIEPIRFVFFPGSSTSSTSRNEDQVFDDTGRAGYTTDEARVRATGTRELVNSLDAWFTHPEYYSEPRRIEFGMNLEF